MPDIMQKITINADKGKVYNALSSVEGLSGWWTRTTSGKSSPGETLEFRFNQHAIHMRVKDLQADKSVAWDVAEQEGEWAGTRLTFDLSEEKGRTTLIFGHRAWQEASPHFAHCSMKWATFLLSLRDYAETGKGRPFPDDVQI